MKIINIKQDKTYTLYMGRENKWLNLPQSKWHNPFPMKKEIERPKCIYDFTNYFLWHSNLVVDIHELYNEVCGCYCVPRLCHCHILAFAEHHGSEHGLNFWRRCNVGR